MYNAVIDCLYFFFGTVILRVTIAIQVTATLSQKKRLVTLYNNFITRILFNSILIIMQIYVF